MKERPSDEIDGLPPALSELPWSDEFVMQAIEILPVAAVEGDGVVAWRPEHADSFIVGWPAGARPEEVAHTALQRLGLEPVVLHSTSWRHGDGEVILTYLAVVDAIAPPQSWTSVAVARADLARGDALAPPPVIGVQQVLEHGLRHLAWLLREDEAVQRALGGWAARLRGYEPEPFRSFGPGPATG